MRMRVTFCWEADNEWMWAGREEFWTWSRPAKRCNTPQIHVRVHIFRKMWRIQMQNWCFSMLWNENCLNIVKDLTRGTRVSVSNKQRAFLMVTFHQHIFAKFPTIIPPANKRHGFCKIFVRQINFPSAFNCRCCVPSARKVIICGLPTVRFFLLRQKIYISMHFRHFREFQLIPNLSSCGLRHQQSPSSASLWAAAHHCGDRRRMY